MRLSLGPDLALPYENAVLRLKHPILGNCTSYPRWLYPNL